jgi:uncharacterized small protein (DUF1192 family)
MSEPDDVKKKPVNHVVGEELSSLSVAELRERIAQLQEEMARLERAVAAKGSARSAADAFFRL